MGHLEGDNANPREGEQAGRDEWLGLSSAHQEASPTMPRLWLPAAALLAGRAAFLCAQLWHVCAFLSIQEVWAGVPTTRNGQRAGYLVISSQSILALLLGASLWGDAPSFRLCYPRGTFAAAAWPSFPLNCDDLLLYFKSF